LITEPEPEDSKATEAESMEAAEPAEPMDAELLLDDEDEDSEEQIDAASGAHSDDDDAGEIIDVVGSALPVASSSMGLAARDPLRAYMAEISRYALLSPEEEKELAIRYQETADPKVAYSLVTANLRLVAKIAFKYRRFYKNVLDLIQEGNIGLMKAVQKFDPYRGVRLSTYARYWIQAYVMYFLLANHRIVKVGTTQAKRKLFYNLTKETKRLRDMGFDPTPQRIAESLDVDVKDVIEMKQRLASPDASLEAPVGGSDERSLGSTLPSRDPGPEAPVEHAEMMSLVSGAMRAFAETITNEREIMIWTDRLMSEDPRTLEDIGQDFGVTRERARQIEAGLKKKLKAYLLEKLGTEVELSVEML
jgi:RNA polymerase sigma-32 factor